MPIDPSQALDAELPSVTSSWSVDDVILYHLGLGAGDPATDPVELAYCYEAKLKVLPSFGVIAAQPVLAGIMGIPGLEFNPALLLHGEQDLEIKTTPPTAAKVSTSGRVAALYDKGKAALAVIETETQAEDGTVLFVNRWSMFLRGEGGFGGEPGPKSRNQAPDRAPDLVVESTTLPQQALIYRLSGDKNPLHVDPEFAKMAGFDPPILHGLSTYGVVLKAVVDNALDGDTSRVGRYEVRFAGVVFPGDTIVTSIWNEEDRIVLTAATKEADAPVLTNAAVTLR